MNERSFMDRRGVVEMTGDKPLAGQVALGFRAGRGGSVIVGVALDGEPRIVLSTYLPTAADGDRLAFEPYHLAFEMAQAAGGELPAEAAAAVAEGRRRQEVRAADLLGDIVRRLQGEGRRPAAAALLVNRAGWISDLLQYSLFDPGHPPVAEGLAVRDALRFAIDRCGLALVEMDEKSLPEAARTTLGLSPGELEGRLKALGAAAGRPWRKEQKLACLAAWLTTAGAV
jgi:hypothetical protein